MEKKISRSSKVLSKICSALIGPPKALGMPEDFYYRQADRHIPPPAADGWDSQRKRLYVNLSRDAMTWRLLEIAGKVNLAFFGALAILPIFLIFMIALIGGAK